jgi:hypothetical protein
VPARTLRLRLSYEIAPSSSWRERSAIRQVDGLNLSTVIATSPLRAVVILPQTNFHEISRAAGPKGSYENEDSNADVRIVSMAARLNGQNA